MRACFNKTLNPPLPLLLLVFNRNFQKHCAFRGRNILWLLHHINMNNFLWYLTLQNLRDTFKNPLPAKSQLTILISVLKPRCEKSSLRKGYYHMVTDICKQIFLELPQNLSYPNDWKIETDCCITAKIQIAVRNLHSVTIRNFWLEMSAAFLKSGSPCW